MQKIKTSPQSAEAVRTQSVKKTVVLKSAVYTAKSIKNGRQNQRQSPSNRPRQSRGQGGNPTNKRSVVCKLSVVSRQTN